MKKLTLILCLSASACSGESSIMTAAPDQSTAFRVTVDNIAPWTVLKSGVVATKVGGSAAGPLGPGDAYETTFTAGKGQALAFATMLGESNDWFFAPGPDGIALYDSAGMPLSGDVTDQVKLWDAGTEENQEPGVGDATGPRQPSPDFGAPDPNPMVRELDSPVPLRDGSSFALPAVKDMIGVILTPLGDRAFKLRIENRSTDTTLRTTKGRSPIHLSPTVWALQGAAGALFEPGTRDRGQGLEQLAEAGDPTMLGSAIAELSGAATPVSPGVFVVHASGEPLFSLGLPDRGAGLEHLAEDGDNSALAAALAAEPPDGASSTGTFDTPVGASAPGAAAPGHGYELTVNALPGERLSFATMFGMSNDWVFATPPAGLALFDDLGQPVSGEVTDQVGLYDVGTEINEELAIGPDTGPQEPAKNTGAADPIAQVRAVSDSEYAAPVSAHLRITIEPQ
jgi:hypothetical protein